LSLCVVGVMLGDYGFFSFPMVDFSCWRKVTELPPSSRCLLQVRGSLRPALT
jgi:hypothetical protein